MSGSNLGFDDAIKLEGGTDDTEIGNIGDRLKVDTTTTQNPPVSVLNAKYRILYAAPGTTIGTSYATIYSYTGSGILHAFALKFSSDNVRVRLTIDGTEVIFELSLPEIDVFMQSSASGISDGVSTVIAKFSSSRMETYFKEGFKYESSVLIEAQKTTGADKTHDNQIVFITKDT